MLTAGIKGTPEQTTALNTDPPRNSGTCDDVGIYCHAFLSFTNRHHRLLHSSLAPLLVAMIAMDLSLSSKATSPRGRPDLCSAVGHHHLLLQMSLSGVHQAPRRRRLRHCRPPPPPPSPQPSPPRRIRRLHRRIRERSPVMTKKKVKKKEWAKGSRLGMERKNQG